MTASFSLICTFWLKSSCYIYQFFVQLNLFLRLKQIHLNILPIVKAFREDLLPYLMAGCALVTPHTVRGIQLLHDELTRIQAVSWRKYLCTDATQHNLLMSNSIVSFTMQTLAIMRIWQFIFVVSFNWSLKANPLLRGNGCTRYRKWPHSSAQQINAIWLFRFLLGMQRYRWKSTSRKHIDQFLLNVNFWKRLPTCLMVEANEVKSSHLLFFNLQSYIYSVLNAIVSFVHTKCELICLEVDLRYCCLLFYRSILISASICLYGYLSIWMVFMCYLEVDMKIGISLMSRQADCILPKSLTCTLVSG